MALPCPHCGGSQEFTERKPDEIKPIIPLDLQGSFKEPSYIPNDIIPPNTPPYQPSTASIHEYVSSTLPNSQPFPSPNPSPIKSP
ncbi:MAG: hypothetical protein ACXABU_16215, partial [Candidatus Hodarchaeales archaeon]